MDAVDDTAAQLGLEPEPESSSSFLVVLIDLHGENWIDHAQYSLWTVLTSALVFMNAHMALDSGNELAVIGYNGAGTRMLHSTVEPHDPTSEDGCAIKGHMIRQFKSLDKQVTDAVQEHIKAAAELADPKARTSVAGPLSLALTYLNRQIRQSVLSGHILVLTASPDNVGSKYITAMNSIFTAQKMRIPVDSAIFGESNSFLQQAADFTGGSFLEFPSPRDSAKEELPNLLPIFMSVYLIEPSVRPHINLATKPDVDFSAVCFVSKKIIEIGMVCSVCLCIMAAVPPDRKCPVCHTEYEASPQTISNS